MTNFNLDSPGSYDPEDVFSIDELRGIYLDAGTEVIEATSSYDEAQRQKIADYVGTLFEQIDILDMAERNRRRPTQPGTALYFWEAPLITTRFIKRNQFPHIPDSATYDSVEAAPPHCKEAMRTRVAYKLILPAIEAQVEKARSIRRSK